VPSNKTFIGIDGGGTKTVCVIGDETGKLLASATGGSSNIQSKPLPEVKETLFCLIEEVLEKSNTNPGQLDTVYFALAGGDRPTDKQRILRALDSLTRQKVRVVIENDAMAALASGTWGEPGIVLIAGTGSIAYACSANNPISRIGGWGYLLGDEGSGYDIGRKGLSAALRHFDGRGEKTILTERLMGHFGVSSPEEFISAVYSADAPKEKIAGVSKVVFAAAKREDRVALRIVDDAINELVTLVRASRRTLETEEWPIVLSGGLFSDSVFKNQFLKELNRKVGNLWVVFPTVPSAVGSFILALKHSKPKVTDELKEMIQTSWAHLQK
jgi:N-acetylglucosamine kinase-like BadF-type ATPase